MDIASAGFLNIRFDKIFTGLFSMLQQEPAACAVKGKNTYLRLTGAHDTGQFFIWKYQKLFALHPLHGYSPACMACMDATSISMACRYSIHEGCRAKSFGL